MNFIDNIYLIFLGFTREDRFGDRHKRAAAFLEIIITFILTFFTMLSFGLFNLKIENFLIWLLIISIYGLIRVC